MNQKKELKVKGNYLYITSFLVTFALYMMLWVTLRLYPLSDNTVLFSDMNNQFVSFYNFYKHIFTTNNNILYTFSKNLGGDMIGFSAYYLQNPFALILFLFPYKFMPVGIYLMEAIMLSTASVTFQIFINKTFGRGSLVFSTAYGMTGYVLAYFTLPTFFCNIILLPIVIMGFHMMLSKEKGKITGKLVYAVSLFFSIICNYYLGYMTCLFLALYFVYYVVSNTESVREALASAKTFIVCSVVAVLLTSFDLIPIAISLSGQKAAPSSSIFSLSRTFRLADLYKSLLPARYPIDYSNFCLPYIYVGIIPVLCIVILLISRKTKIQEKIASVLLIIVLVLSMYIKPIDTIWHAFNEPVGFAHRFAFLLCFTLLLIGFKGYMLALDKDVKPGIFAAVFIFAMAELLYNANHVLKVQVADCKSESYYSEYYDRMNPVISKIKSVEDENDLYRIEKDVQYTMVDSMAFDYAGLSHNSSCEKDYVKEFMGNMGFRNQGIWAFYNQGSTAFADCFLGVKHFVSRFDFVDKPYEEEFEMNDLYSYKNPYALAFASIVDTDKIRELNYNNNTFEFQNNIAKCYGFDGNIYNEAKVTEIRAIGNIKCGEGLKNRVNKNYVNLTIKPELEDDKSYIEFDIEEVEPYKTLYMYFGAEKMQGARIYVNGVDWEDYFSDWRWAVERAGRFADGEKVTIRIEATGDDLLINDYHLYFENEENILAWYDSACKMGADKIKLSKISSSHLKGTVGANDDGILLFSMPYDKGWKIKIDGAKVTQEELLSALMGVEISKGEHIIEMNYVPVGLIPGIIISLITLFMVGCYIIRDRIDL